MTRPLVSTIIPVFNRPLMLREAVASVQAQTYREIEIIIVDDGSTDSTGAIASELAAHDETIRVVRQDNGGPGLAREAGRLQARGAYLQYLDSDDLLLPDKFERQVEGLEAHPECGVSYGWTRLERDDGSSEPLPWKRTGERIGEMFPTFLQARWWDTMTPLYRAEVCAKAGAWTSLRMEEDWEYDCRIASQGVRLHHVAGWVAINRRHRHGQLSGAPASKTALHLVDRARAHELIFRHAQAAAIPSDAPEMRHFARELFLLARLCGAEGLDDEARRLFALSREASGAEGNRMQFRIYQAMSEVIGWRATGRLADMSDRLRARAWRTPRS